MQSIFPFFILIIQKKVLSLQKNTKSEHEKRNYHSNNKVYIAL